jgi:hypothetical protein
VSDCGSGKYLFDIDGSSKSAIVESIEAVGKGSIKI